MQPAVAGWDELLQATRREPDLAGLLIDSPAHGIDPSEAQRLVDRLWWAAR
jgi:hypothetical protein